MGEVDAHERTPELVSVQVPRLGLPSPVSVEQPFISDQQMEQTEPQQSLPGDISHNRNGPIEDHSAQSSRNSPEPAQVDQQGHYVGPASGASFLLRIQRKLQQQPTFTSETSIFTFGDLPLAEPDTSIVILPPREEANELLARYFDFASATHRFLHRPTVQEWLDELCDTNGAMRDKATARSRKALLFMLLAYAKNYPKGGTGSVDPEASAIFFSAAEDQLAGEKGAIRLTSVQARLAQCFYLLSQSRLNHTWTLFGTTAHLALALGIHRRRLGDSHGVLDYVDLECRKRTFWCMYNLDTYLSAALGRPRSFHDEDIDQELPASLNDTQIRRRTMDLSAIGSQSIMSGSVAHFRLSRIVANVLRDFYGIRSRSTESQITMASAYSKDLGEWWNSMKYLLNTAKYDSSLFLPIFLRQRNVLNLAFWHAQILLYRPFLLNSFASLTNLSLRRNTRTAHAANVAGNVELCLGAAMNIVNLVDEINTTGQLYNAFWFTHYFAFCAVVVIYVYAIQCWSDENFNTLQAASRCQAQMSTRAIPGSLSERYGVVLQELQLEMLRHKPSLRAMFPEEQIRQSNGRSGHDYNPFPPAQTNQEAGNGLSGDDANDPIDSSLVFQDGPAAQMVEPSPSSSVAQMSGWGQFDSLVTSGIAGFGWDGVLSDNPVEGWDLTNTNL
ncbi:Fc.00g045850.m01.CDS01 [Cosmosporella sp. VM-42]